MSGRADGSGGQTVRFGVIERVLLLGGSWLTAALCRRLVGGPCGLALFAGLRHLDDAIDPEGTTLRALVGRLGVPYVATDDINREPRMGEFLTERTLGIALGAPWVFEREVVARFGGRFSYQVGDFGQGDLPSGLAGTAPCVRAYAPTRRGCANTAGRPRGWRVFEPPRAPAARDRARRRPSARA